MVAIVEPISLLPVVDEVSVLVGIVYTGNAVGNNNSSNIETNVSPFKSPTVVPDGIPPKSSVVAIASANDVLYTAFTSTLPVVIAYISTFC